MTVAAARTSARSLWLICSAPWRDQLQGTTCARQMGTLQQRGNIVYLPAPIAAYRLRHTVCDTIVEIVSHEGHITHIDRSATAAAARQLLSMIWADHSRPVLPEVVDGIMSGGGA